MADDARWLSPDQQQSWRSYLEAAKVLFDALDRQLQHDADMPHTYYEILVRLSEASGRAMRMSELADVTLSSRSRLSHAVARLEERGWVRREDCTTDRRGQLARLTELGMQVLRDTAPKHVAAVRDLVIDALTPAELTRLGEISALVSARVAQAGQVPAAALTASAPAARATSQAS